MAELEKSENGGCSERLIGFLLLFLILPPLFYLDSIITENAKSHCPYGTFLSGITHNWSGWGITLFGVAIWFAVAQVIAHWFLPSGYEGKDMFAPFGKVGLSVLATFFVASAFVYWIASSSQLCLAPDGIHHRVLPWQDFRLHSWSDVKKIAVECRNGHRSPDLYYTVTFRDGAELDIADAMPSWAPSPDLHSHLIGVPFQFTREVRSDCPAPYADWVGQRP